jgi:hypothetical protein
MFVHIIKPRRSLPGWSVRPNEQPPRQALGLTRQPGRTDGRDARPCRLPRDRRFGLRPQSGTRGVLPYAAPLVAGAPPPLVAIAGPRGLFGTGRKIFRLFSLALVSVHQSPARSGCFLPRFAASGLDREEAETGVPMQEESRRSRCPNLQRGMHP